MRVLNSRQMREADRRTIEEVGVPSLVLMEHAGREVVRAMDAAFEDLADRRVAVLCGRGNNGGDGFVVARLLAERGIDVSVYVIGAAHEIKGDARVNLQALGQLDLDVVEVGDAATWERHAPDVLARDVVVDALFGTGLRGPVSGLVETVIADVNASDRPVVAIDLPSGLSADTAEVPGTAVNAVMTVTLGAPKLPLVLPPAERLAGQLVVADIGIPEAVIAALDGPRVDVLTRAAMRPLIRPRAADAHKGDFGRVLIVAGSPGRTGAAALAGRAALRAGAGLVTIAVPRSSAAIVAALGAEYMTLALDEAPDGTIADEAARTILAFDADVVAMGPGLGRSPSVAAAVHALVERSDVPLVLDADAVVAFAGHLELLGGHRGPVVLTPHPGEMARLVGASIEAIQSHRVDAATDLATARRVHVVLKGHRTLVAAPDGRVAVNVTGNPGMATAGAGDVLTGMIAARCAQLHDVDAAARLAVYLHGRAGDVAADAHGQVSLIAGDIIEALGEAVLDLIGPEPPPAAIA
ncbi:MAG: NAD(P)H-hydrate dehydratase [Acidobacteria bacterium]|nr:NAD(P)H-hydrate dehydratase [Acidobacteriota bacterium]